MSNTAKSNKAKGDAFTQRVHDYLKRNKIDLVREFKVDVGLSSIHKKKHAFDLGSKDRLVECKYYDWTDGDNNPSAKIATLNEAMLFLYTSPSGVIKQVFVRKTGKKGKRKPETFAEYYVRLYKHCIPDDVEFWEFDETNSTAQKM